MFSFFHVFLPSLFLTEPPAEKGLKETNTHVVRRVEGRGGDILPPGGDGKNCASFADISSVLLLYYLWMNSCNHMYHCCTLICFQCFYPSLHITDFIGCFSVELGSV